MPGRRAGCQAPPVPMSTGPEAVRLPPETVNNHCQNL